MVHGLYPHEYLNLHFKTINERPNDDDLSNNFLENKVNEGVLDSLNDLFTHEYNLLY